MPYRLAIPLETGVTGFEPAKIIVLETTAVPLKPHAYILTITYLLCIILLVNVLRKLAGPVVNGAMPWHRPFLVDVNIQMFFEHLVYFLLKIHPKKYKCFLNIWFVLIWGMISEQKEKVLIRIKNKRIGTSDKIILANYKTDVNRNLKIIFLLYFSPDQPYSDTPSGPSPQ